MNDRRRFLQTAASAAIAVPLLNVPLVGQGCHNGVGDGCEGDINHVDLHITRTNNYYNGIAAQNGSKIN